jgi:pseudaminic acid synthase
MTTFALPDRTIDQRSPVFVIAELSGNHNGSKARAQELIHAAAEAGADAVKLQTYTADTITMDAPGEWFRIRGGPWDGRGLYELYQEASTPWEWHADLFAEAKRRGLVCFSTPFDPTAVDYLEELGAPLHKVASFEVVDIPLLEKIGATRKPVIMSTGMASLAEIDAAVKTLRTHGCPSLALLHCVSAYPARAADMHLATIPHLAQAFQCVAGLSDHSLTATAAVAATALGARVLEKHLCLRRADGGPDSGFSLEPAELAATIQAVREAHAATTQGVAYGPGTADVANVQFRKSLFSACDIPAGTVITRQHLRDIRPGHGLPPADLPRILGRTTRVFIPRGTPLAWDQF